jgi:hypothetical protein
MKLLLPAAQLPKQELQQKQQQWQQFQLPLQWQLQSTPQLIPLTLCFAAWRPYADACPP